MLIKQWKRVLIAVAAVGGLYAVFAWSANRDDAAMKEQSTQAQFERDRQSILAMVGTYQVTFDMRETVPFVTDYQPLPAKTSGGYEVVKVIEDTGTHISLQHLLVVAGDEDASEVVKHWRQTWDYQPQQVLVYVSTNRWTLQSVPVEQRHGVWSQTVWQTDDSPRYGGVGRWQYDGGVARWTSNATLRPLARRDAIRHPVYDRYLGINRHALTPNGWVHEQDNAKLGMRDGASVTFVHEVVLNTYQRTADFDTQAANHYWDKTQAYWAAIRHDWQALIRERRGIDVKEEADNGSVTGQTLMTLAERVANGELDTASAIAAARGEIALAVSNATARL